MTNDESRELNHQNELFSNAGNADTVTNKLEATCIDDDFSDDELSDLFSTFDEVSASDELKATTLAAITASEGATDSKRETSPDALDNTSPSPEVKIIAGGKAARARKAIQWRVVRVAAIAACLVMALSGGVAYALPAQYYEVAQEGSTIILGVNCFGMTVSVSADDEAGKQIIASSDLRNMPYEESLSRAVELMVQHDPYAPVEYGPQGGEHQSVSPSNIPGDEPGEGEAVQGNMHAAQPNEGAQQPQGSDANNDAGQPQGAGASGGAEQPQTLSQNPNDPKGGGSERSSVSRDNS